MEADGSQSDWRISIQKRLDRENEDDKNNKWTNVTIYRATPNYKEVNRDSLEPKIVSLGPYHRSNSKADPHKWRALHYMLKRNKQQIGLYIDAMMELEPKARSCYEGDISLNKTEFVEMMVLNGCFIIKFLLYMNGKRKAMGYPDSEPFIGDTVFFNAITVDMMLLENQIPFFVLEKLAKLQQNPVIGVGFIPNIVISLFNLFLSSGSGNPDDAAEDWNEGINGDHLLDIVRRNLLVKISNSDRDEKDDTTIFQIPCASKLKETRVKFKVRKEHPFWEVNFSDRTLQMKQLCLEDGSKTLFCNLIAYEQHLLDPNKVIMGYFVFMNELIKSTKDVQYLIELKIINSLIGNYDKVVDLFDKITTNADFSLENSYLKRIVNNINKHCDSTWYKWRANLIDTYFKNPWSTISFVAAFLLLVFTFIQTFYTVYGYYSPRKS